MSRISSDKYQTSPLPSRAQSPTASVSSYSSSRLNYTSSPLPSPANSRNGCMTAAAKRYRYLRRLFKFRQMDFQYAAWQMLYLFVSPKKVYRNFQYRKQTKAQFARDDPAFVVLLCLWLFVTSIGFAIMFHLGIMGFLSFLLYAIFVDTILAGIIVATALWFVTNHYMLKPTCVDQDVEWGYAFDVHLNAYFPSLVILHFFQLLLFPIFLDQVDFFSKMAGNLLWMIAIGYYIYITFLGYNSLSILQKTRCFLFGLPALLAFFLVSLGLGWNMSSAFMRFYRHRVL